MGRYSIADLLALTTLAALVAAGATSFPEKEAFPILLMTTLTSSSIFALPSSVMTLHTADEWAGAKRCGNYLLTWAMALSILVALVGGLEVVPTIFSAFLGYFLGITTVCLSIRIAGFRLTSGTEPCQSGQDPEGSS